MLSRVVLYCVCVVLCLCCIVFVLHCVVFMFAFTGWFLHCSDARPRAAASRRVCEGPCSCSWRSVNAPILTPISFRSVSCPLPLSPSSPPLPLSPASCSHHHHRAGALHLCSRHWEPAAGGRRSPLSGARMRCHKFWGAWSFGFYVWTAMLFRGRWGEKWRSSEGLLLFLDTFFSKCLD